MKNDMEMQQEVLAELGRDGSLVPGAVGVEVHHGVFKLAGKVSDQTMKDRSGDAARRVGGVTRVILDIDVDPVGGASRSANGSREARFI